MDATHKQMRSGYPLITFGTTTMDQAWHMIAYTIASNENTATNQFIIRSIRRAVEDLVRMKKKQQQKEDALRSRVGTLLENTLNECKCCGNSFQSNAEATSHHKYHRAWCTFFLFGGESESMDQRY